MVKESVWKTIDPRVTSVILSGLSGCPLPAGIGELTGRETEVLRALCKGMVVKEIADHLGITYHGVTKHLRNIYAKLGVNRQVEAVAIALRAGFGEGGG